MVRVPILGDPIEVHAIEAVYGKERQHPLYLGAVKAHVGHLEAAAGMAGVIKTVLALQHELLPAQIHFHQLNSQMQLTIPGGILTSSMPWPQKEPPRRAGISSFGFSGTNAHVILEEAPKLPECEPIKLPKAHLLVLSAKTQASLEKLRKAYLTYLKQTKERLVDICFTAAIGRGQFNWRIALIVKNKAELIRCLSHPELELREIEPLDEVVQSNQVEELAKAYAAGCAIDWSFYYKPYRKALRKVSLPTYAFDRQRYWMEVKPVSQSLGYGPRMHELLGVRLPGSGEEVCFFNTISLQEQRYLREHQVLTFVLMPAAGFIESALAAGRYLQGEFPIELKDIAFNRALPFIEDVVCDYELRLKPTALGYEGLIASHQAGHDWITHTIFQLAREIKPRYEVVSLDTLKEHKTSQDISEIYPHFAQAGLQYGPNFQVIQAVWKDSKEVLAHLSLAKDLHPGDYLLHPTLLDGALQAVALLNPTEQVFIPSSVASLRCYRPIGSTCWVLVKDFHQDAESLSCSDYLV